MSDNDVAFHETERDSIPNKCPHCNRGFEKTKSGESYPAFHFTVSEIETEHGQCTETHCVCDFPLKREYKSDVEFSEDPFVDPEQWVYRAKILQLDTALSERESQVQALKEEGLSHEEVADVLDISPSTVGEYVGRVRERQESAMRTLEEIKDQFDPRRQIESQLSQTALFPGSELDCDSCGSIVTHGDNVTAVCEWDTDQWKLMALSCGECGATEIQDIRGDDYFENLVESSREHDIPVAVCEGELAPYGMAGGKMVTEDSLSFRDASLISLLS